MLEAAGSSSGFGGNNRLLRFPPGSTNYQVVIPFIPAPVGVAVSRTGVIWVGSYGAGNTGRVFEYSPGSTNPVTLAQNLPAVNDLAADTNQNLYFAGSGSGPLGLAGVEA